MLKEKIKIFLIPIVIFSLCVSILNLYSNINHILPYKQATITSINYKNTRPEYITKAYIKSEVDKMFDYKYSISYKNLNDCNGYSNLIRKSITIDKSLSCEQFAMTLTHELVHLTYFTSNERFTSLKSFQKLYESNNEYFKNVALCYANNDFMGLAPKEYSCAGYIEEYLKYKFII